MRMALRSRGPVVLAVLVALAAGTARADMPPPDGSRYVGYGFRVDNVAAFPEFVVLAFPWSTSNGRPMRDYTEVKAGEVIGVGRRGGAPELYAMRRADYEAWKAGNPDVQEGDPRLEALFTGDKVMKCGAQVSPRHTVPSSTQGDIVDAFTAVAIDANRCQIVAAAAQPTSPAETKPTSPANPPETPPAAPNAAGCKVDGERRLGLAGILLLLGLGRRRASA